MSRAADSGPGPGPVRAKAAPVERVRPSYVRGAAVQRIDQVERVGQLALTTTDEQTLSANVCFFASHSGHSQPM